MADPEHPQPAPAPKSNGVLAILSLLAIPVAAFIAFLVNIALGTTGALFVLTILGFCLWCAANRDQLKGLPRAAWIASLFLLYTGGALPMACAHHISSTKIQWIPR